MKPNSRRSHLLSLAWFVLSLSGLHATSFAQTNYESARIDSPPAALTGDWGGSLALSGTRLLSSALGPYDDLGFPVGGSPRTVYVHDVQTGAQLHALQASDGVVSDAFGSALAAEGTVALIGSPFDDDLGVDSGSVYSFDLLTGQQLTKWTSSTGGPRDRFGSSIAIDGGLAIVGAPGEDTSGGYSGAAYVFDITTGQQLFRLAPPVPERGAGFGARVALGGGLAVVARDPYRFPGGQPIVAPSVDVFDANSGQWLYALQPAQAGPEFHFGRDVAVSGSRVLVGEPLRGAAALPLGTNGVVHVHDGATGAWLHDLVGPTVDQHDGFGGTLRTDGGLVAVGAPLSRVGLFADGAAYVFDVATGALRSRLISSTPTSNAYEPFLNEVLGFGANLGLSLAYDAGRVVSRVRGPGATPDEILATTLVFEDTVVHSGSATCFGDGSGTACPCGVDGFLGEGCRSNSGRGGHLQGAGEASLVQSRLRLIAHRLPAGVPLLLFQGTSQTAVAFGEGIRCTNASFRFPAQVSDAHGAAVFTGVEQQASAGSTLHYQAWFRDPLSGCGMGNFNLTNAWSVTW